jgi:hypothetical protein
MRSFREVTFRLRQEVNNLRLWALPPEDVIIPLLPFPQFPSPQAIARRVANTKFAETLVALADDFVRHRIHLPGGTLQLPTKIEWRRDYRNERATDTGYFRLVPYLDFNRAGDHKVIWDLNRHQHLVVMAQAALLTGDQKFVGELEQQVDSWIDSNPFMRGINWTSALEVAFRAMSWLWILHLIGDHLESGTKRRIGRELYRHGLYLEHNLSIFFSPNTHLLGEAVILHALGALFPDSGRANQWRTVGSDLVSRQMAAQVRDDGSHFEASSYYHVYALDLFLFHAVLVDASSSFKSKLSRMADYLDALMGPARALPLIGDDDGGRVFHPYGPREHFGRATLATCARFFHENNWRYSDLDLHEQADWWIAATETTAPSSHVNSTAESTFFADSGTAVMCSGPIHIIVDGGAFGPGNGGHSHSDTLSIVMRDGTEEILVDAGTFTYVSDPTMRDWFRGTAAHNTIRVDGTDQAVPNGPFRWSVKPDVRMVEWGTEVGRDLFDGVCSWQNGAFALRRRVMLLKSSPKWHALLVVADSVEGPAGTHTVEQFWHPGADVVRVGPDHIRIGGRSNLMVPPGNLLETVNHWRSREFGHMTPREAFVVRRVSALPIVMWSVVCVDNASIQLSSLGGSNELLIDVLSDQQIKASIDPAGKLCVTVSPAQSTTFPRSGRHGPRDDSSF